jgi:50S ribosomal protein L16 3-hydroxylase
MLRLPGKLSAEKFLADYWQKNHLFMPQALDRLRPAISRNELGWLATLDDVESRLVFTKRRDGGVRYHAETGPFDAEYLAALPQKDWTLLVHDVEKHLPVMRKLFAHVPFIPDWRIDDLMVSFAAPGGGVGPHQDNYDVFLCQGIGVREWHVATGSVDEDPDASDDLALTLEFQGQQHTAREGDVLYLPPGVPHWGTATRACITYSIGMRAPQLSDLAAGLSDTGKDNPFYSDSDLAPDEALPGRISARAIERASRLLGAAPNQRARAAEALGRYVTTTKDWITPEGASTREAAAMLESLHQGGSVTVHGMARIAYDDCSIYVNGSHTALLGGSATFMDNLCASRRIQGPLPAIEGIAGVVGWIAQSGGFELPETELPYVK